MKQLAPHLKQPGARIGNLWLLESGSQRILIDTGHPLERPALLPELMLKGRILAPGELTAIVLTHRHSDHAGNAAWMRKRFGARVYCHENDASALQGKVTPHALASIASTDAEAGGAGSRRRKPRFYERWIAAYEDRAPAFCEIDGTFTEGLWQWGLRVIPTPGHTEGSVMLYHEPTRTLFTGDAIVAGPRLAGLVPDPKALLARATARLPGVRDGLKRASQLPGTTGSLVSSVASVVAGDPAAQDPKRLRLADPAFTPDVESCHRAVRKFIKDAPPIDYLCPGHGPALGPDDEIAKRLARLLRD